MSNGRCRNHGGKSLKGPDSPRYIHGGRTKESIELGREVTQITKEIASLLKAPDGFGKWREEIYQTSDPEN